MRDPVLDELFREVEVSGRDTVEKSGKLGKKVKILQATLPVSGQAQPETILPAETSGSTNG